MKEYLFTFFFNNHQSRKTKALLLMDHVTVRSLRTFSTVNKRVHNEPGPNRLTDDFVG